jgi:hypothetical protein
LLDNERKGSSVGSYYLPGEPPKLATSLGLNCVIVALAFKKTLVTFGFTPTSPFKLNLEF